jgi:anti-sigma regulatory factor (Ser/Thr protein kinase)
MSVDAFTVDAMLDGGIDAARRSRRLLESELRGRVPEQVLEDAELLMTELVANGVRHGGAGDAEALRIRLQGRPGSLRVEVEDPGSNPFRVAPRQADIENGGGIGLQLVDQVARRWGVGQQPPTTVWFELECTCGQIRAASA